MNITLVGTGHMVEAVGRRLVASDHWGRSCGRDVIRAAASAVECAVHAADDRHGTETVSVRARSRGFPSVDAGASKNAGRLGPPGAFDIVFGRGTAIASAWPIGS